MNTTQAAQRSPCAELIPALIRNSQIFSFKDDRIMTPAEMFQVQGFPVFVPVDFPFRCGLESLGICDVFSFVPLLVLHVTCFCLAFVNEAPSNIGSSTATRRTYGGIRQQMLGGWLEMA